MRVCLFEQCTGTLPGELGFFHSGGFWWGWLVCKKIMVLEFIGCVVGWGLTRSDGRKCGLTDLCENATMGGIFFVRNATWASLCGPMTYSGVRPSPNALFFGITLRISNSKRNMQFPYSMVRFCPKKKMPNSVAFCGLRMPSSVRLLGRILQA